MNSENIVISVGVEIDKKQINEKSIQGQINDSVGNAKIQIQEFQIGDVSKKLQSEIDKSVKKVKIEFKDTNISKSQLNSISKKLTSIFEDINNSKNLISLGNSAVDTKGFEKAIREGLSETFGNAVKDVKIDFGKTSITNVAAVARNIHSELQNELEGRSKLNPKIDFKLESVDSDGINKIIQSIAMGQFDEFRKVGLKYGTEFSNEFTRGLIKSVNSKKIQEAVDRIAGRLVFDSKDVEKKVKDNLYTDLKNLGQEVIKNIEYIEALNNGYAKNLESFTAMSKAIEDLNSGKLITTSSFYPFDIEKIEDKLKRLQSYIERVEGKSTTRRKNTSFLSESANKIQELIDDVASVNPEGLQKINSELEKLRSKIHDINISVADKNKPLDTAVEKLKELEGVFSDEIQFIDFESEKGEILLFERQLKELDKLAKKAMSAPDKEGYKEFKEQVSNLKKDFYGLKNTGIKEELEEVGKNATVQLSLKIDKEKLENDLKLTKFEDLVSYAGITINKVTVGDISKELESELNDSVSRITLNLNNIDIASTTEEKLVENLSDAFKHTTIELTDKMVDVKSIDKAIKEGLKLGVVSASHELGININKDVSIKNVRAVSKEVQSAIKQSLIIEPEGLLKFENLDKEITKAINNSFKSSKVDAVEDLADELGTKFSKKFMNSLVKNIDTGEYVEAMNSLVSELQKKKVDGLDTEYITKKFGKVWNQIKDINSEMRTFKLGETFDQDEFDSISKRIKEVKNLISEIKTDNVIDVEAISETDKEVNNLKTSLEELASLMERATNEMKGMRESGSFVDKFDEYRNITKDIESGIASLSSVYKADEDDFIKKLNGKLFGFELFIDTVEKEYKDMVENINTLSEEDIDDINLPIDILDDIDKVELRLEDLKDAMSEIDDNIDIQELEEISDELEEIYQDLERIKDTGIDLGKIENIQYLYDDISNHINKLKEGIGEDVVVEPKVETSKLEDVKQVVEKVSETSNIEMPIDVIPPKDTVEEIKDVEQEIEKVAENSNFEMPIDIVVSEPTETIISGIEDIVEDVEDSGEFNIELDVFISEESKIRIQKQLEELSEGLSVDIKDLKLGESSKLNIEDVELAIDMYAKIQSKIDDISNKIKLNINGVNLGEGIVNDIKKTFDELSKNVDSMLESSVDSIVNTLSDRLSKNIQLDFSKIKFLGLKDRIAEISQSFNDGIEIKPSVTLSGADVKIDSTSKITESVISATDDVDIERLSSEHDKALKQITELQRSAELLKEGFKAYQLGLREAHKIFKEENSDIIEAINEFESMFDTPVFKRLVKYKRELNDVINEYNTLGVDIVEVEKFRNYNEHSGQYNVSKWKEYLDFIGMDAEHFEAAVERARFLTKEKRRLTKNLENNLTKATDNERALFGVIEDMYDEMPSVDTSKTDNIRELLVSILEDDMFKLDFGKLDLRFEEDLRKAYEQFFVLIKEIQDEYNAKFKNIDGFKEIDIYKNISDSIKSDKLGRLKGEIDNLKGELANVVEIPESKTNTLEDNLGKIADKLNVTRKTSQEVGESLKLMGNYGFDSGIAGARELNNRLQDIVATANEITSINYTFDIGGDLEKAFVTFKDQLGRMYSERFYWTMPEEEDEEPVFVSKLEKASEKFIDINKEALKMQDTLDNIKSNELVDISRIEKVQALIQKLVESIGDLNTEDARKQVDMLSNEIESISLIDKLMTRFDNAFDIRESMGIATEGLEGLRGKIQAINVDTPIKNIRLISREIQRLGSGNSVFIGLQAVIDKATKSLENFGNAKDKLAFEKLNSDINKANKLIEKIGEGAIVSATEVRVLRESVRDVSNELKALENKKVKLNLRLDDLYDSGTIGKRVLNNVKKQVESMTTANVATMFNTLSKSIDSLDNREKAVKQINDALKDTKVKLEELNFKNGTLFEEGKLKKEQNAISKIEEQLIDMVGTLKKSVDDVDIAMVDKALEKLDSAKSKLEKQIDYQKQLNTLTQKQAQLRSALGELDGKIKPVEILKVKDAIDKMKVDTLNEDFKRINDMINKFGKSETTIYQLNKTINKLKSDLDDTKLKVGIDIDNEAIKSGIDRVDMYIRGLENNIDLLEKGVKVSSISISESIDKAKNSYSDLDSVVSRYISNSKKLENVQSRINEAISTRITLDLDVSELNAMQEDLSKVDLLSRDASESIDDITKSLGEFGKSESQITKINKIVAEFTFAMMDLESKSETAWKSSESSYNELLKQVQGFIDIRNKLQSGDNIDNNVLTNYINAFNSGVKVFKSSVNSIISEEKELEKIEKRVDKVTNKFEEVQARVNRNINAAQLLGLDESVIKGINKRLSEIDLTSESASESIAKIVKELNQVDKSENQIVKINNLIETMYFNINELGKKSSTAFSSDIVKGEVFKIATEIKNLTRYRDELENGGFIKPSVITNAVNKLNQYFNSFKSTITGIISEESRIENVYNKFKDLNDKLMGSYESKKSSKLNTDNIQSLISELRGVDLASENAADSIDNISKKFDLLSKSDSQITKLRKTVYEYERSIKELKKTSDTAFDDRKLRTKFNQLESYFSDVKNMMYGLFEGGRLNDNDITEKINLLSTRFKALKSEIDKVASNEDVFGKLSKSLEDIIDTRILLDIDASPLKKIREELNGVILTSEGADKVLKSIAEQLSVFDQTHSQLVKVNKVVRDYEANLKNLEVSSKAAWNNDNLKQGLSTLTNYVKELTKYQTDLINGKDIDSSVLSDVINKLTSGYSNFKTVIDDVVSREDKVKKLKDTLKESMNVRGSLGIDVTSVQKLLENLNKINLTSKNAQRGIEYFAKKINELSKSEGQLVKIDKTIQDLNLSLGNLEKKSETAWNTGKVQGELGELTKQIEELEKVQQDLINGKNIDGNIVADIINKINLQYKNLKTTMDEVSSNESLKKNLKGQLTESLETRIDLKADTSNVDRLIEALNGIDIEAEDAKVKLEELTDEVGNIGKSDTQIRKLQDSISKLSNEIEEVEYITGIVDEDDFRRLTEMRKHLKFLEEALQDVENGISKTGNQIQRMCDEATRSMESTRQSVYNVGNTFSGLGSAINQGMQTALGFEFLDIFTDQLMQMKDAIVELDNEMVGLKRVTTASAEEYDRISKAANQTAIEMGKTTQETLNATTAFVKMGYSISEASDYLSKAGLMLSNVAEMDIESAVNAIVSTMKGMSLDATDAGTIVDVINEAGNKFALNSEDLAEGLRIGAASLKIAGNDLYEASALITAGTEVLQDSKQVANGLRTISMRLRGLSEDGEELNPKLGEMIKTMTGVDLTDTEGQFRSTYEILKDISDVWKDLDTKQQALLLENIAGKTQANVLASVLQNAETLDKAYGDLIKSAGSAEAEQAAYMDSIAGKANALKENFRGIFYDLIDSSAVKGSLDALNSLLSSYRSLAGTLGDLPVLLATVTAAFTTFSSKGRELAANTTELAAAFGYKLPGELSKFGSGLDSLSGNLRSNTKELERKSAKLKTEIQELRESVKANRENSTAIADSTQKVKIKSKELASATRQLALMKAGTIALNAALSMGLSVAISGVIGLLGKMASSSSEAAAKVRELSSVMESMGDNEGLFDEYARINKELASLADGDAKRVELNRELSSIKGQLAGIDDEAYAILSNQNLSYQEQIDLLKSINKEKMKERAVELEKEIGGTGGIGDLFKDTKSDYAKAARSSIEYVLDSYKRLQNLIADSDGKTVNWAGETLGIEEASKKLKEYEDTMRSNMNTLNEYDSYFELIKKAKGETTLETIKLDEATQKEVDSILKLDEASKNSVDGLGAAEGAVDSLGNTTDETVNSLDKLTDAFSKFQAPIELLKTMQEELSKSGGLTDETYRKVLESGDERIIAILANRDTALQNTKDLLKEYQDSESEAAKNLIDNAYASVNALNGVNNELENAHEKATELFKAQAKSSGGIDLSNALGSNYDDLMDPLIDSLDIAKDKVDEFEKDLIDSITEYVNQGGQLYAVDAETKAAFDQAKMNSGEVWKNKEFTDLANLILSKQGEYDKDVIAWANAIQSKNYNSSQFTNETLLKVAQLVNESGINYGIDTQNWINAINSKSINNSNMVNAIIMHFAQMVDKNRKNYNIDVQNWAGAVLNKQNSNANGINTMSNAVAGFINGLANMYVTDANNFASATNSKINNIRAFAGALNTAQKFNSYYSNMFEGKDPSTIKTQEEWLLYQKYQSNKTEIAQGGINLNNIVGTTSTAKPNYVSGTGSSGGKGTSGNKGSGSSSAGKDVADLEKLTDRYYALNNALQKVENQLDAVDTELDGATGKDRIPLLEKEIKLLNDKRTALVNIRNEQQKELAELKKSLAGSGFTFSSDGQISNYASKLDALVAAANKKTGEAKEKAIANVKEVAEKIERYTELLLEEIPDVTNQINGITNSVTDLRDEIEQIIEDTTFFTKDFIDRYYKVNNALKQVENQLNAISVAMENAHDNRMIELLDKQIQLYIEQGKALAEIRKENVKELNELGKELYDAGFKFNADGTLANYESMIDKLVQNANKITDGKKQEKEIERIEELISTIEKYTDLLLSDIPDITNDMDDLANAVIDSQKEIADILAKQRDEYIENLEKETEALKKEIERRKELLQKQWEQEDAEDELAEKQKKLNELEDQLTVALRTGDEELIKNIREQITAAQKEINDFIRDQEREYISDRFDEDLDKIDEDLENKIDEINEKLSDEELLNLVQSGVRDLTDVLNEIENGTRGVRSAFAAIGTTISETWVNALDTFVDKLNSLSDINLGLNLESKLAKAIGGFERVFNITQGDLVVQGNITEDILPTVQNMIDIANNNLINDINMAFSR